MISLLGLAVFSAFVVPMTLSGALPYTTANVNARTLVLSLPGPFNGCSFLDAGVTPTTAAVLDLIRPSAFITNANGTLVGENGPISTAELTSLQPETVRYTISPNETWSNSTVFDGHDLVSWWQRAKVLASVTSDGYRAIKTLSVSRNGLTVTAVFKTPYADWNLLFRDVEAPGANRGCAVNNLVKLPSLGPYVVKSATASRIVMNMNPSWPLDTNRFGRVVLTDSQSLPRTPRDVWADYSLSVNSGILLPLSARPTLVSRITSSSNIEEMTFAPAEPNVDRLVVRQALSWSVERQSMIDSLFGSVTYSPSVAASAIYSQGQSQYPGTGGSNPTGQGTTTTILGGPTDGVSDCVTCAIDTLKESGYRRTSKGWLNDAGTALSIRLAVGPSALDHSVASFVKRDWAHIGVTATLIHESSETSAASAAATSNADVAIFSRPTMTTPSYAARSWAGPAYPNTYPSGDRSSTVTSLFQQASSIFNPVTASATWLRLDQAVLSDYWVRPLFTAPSLVVWSSSLVTVQSSSSVTGFVDQLPTWSIAPPITGS
ncbi:MAG: ABC transporter substrate-binding protein [Acidimicrobiales bacterium]